jgi:hypothetical protein
MAPPHARPLFVLYGASMTQFSFELGGWGAALADLYSRKADILLRGYSGWNTRRAIEALDTIFPKVRSGSWHVYGDPNLGLLFLLGLPNLSAFKCRKKLLKVIIGNLVFTRRWVNNIVSKLQGLANLKWSLPHKVVASWMRICSSYFSWVLADIIAKSSHCFWKCDRKSKCEFHYSCSAYIFSRLICPYLHPLLGVDEVSG